jgi:hypothetical protein
VSFTPHRICILAGMVLEILAAALPGTAAADPAVGVRQGLHGSMGRLVFDFPTPVTFTSHRDGNLLIIRFTPAEPIHPVALHLPGVEKMQGGEGVAQLELAQNAVPQIYRLGDRVVVDTRLHRPGRQVEKALPAIPKRAAAPAQKLAVGRPAASAALAKTAAAPPATSPVSPAAPASLPTPVMSTPEIISFATQPGAAAFRRGDQAILVFDTSEVPDLTALQSSPLFAGAALDSLQDSQVITIPLALSNALAVTPVTGGWQVAAIPATQPGLAPLQNAGSAVEFPMQSANQSIIISDPLTGGDLLVGTVTQPNDAAFFTENGPGYAVLPAWLGVAILPQADNLGLNASLKGFELVSDAPNGLPLGALPPSATNMAATPAAAASGQRLALPQGSTAGLWKQLGSDQRAAAILPPLGRLGAQITLAQDMLALGMGAEAIGVLNTAVLENPAAQDNGRIAAMRAIADVVSHHSQPADFSAPGLIPGTELAFWRAAAALQQGQTAQAIPGLIDGLPLFETYPAGLRNTIAADIAEALADNGKLQAATQLVNSDPDNPTLDLARAKILEHQGHAAAALLAYQGLVHRDDDRVSAIANGRLIELQLAAGRLSSSQAADALDARLFDWRAPEHERHMRLRIAELRAKSGQWPQAFSMLAATASLFPAHRGEIDAIRAAMFLQMLNGDSFTRLAPIEAVSVLQQTQDLIQDSGNSAQVLSLLAQRLDALDLPGAAAPMLSRLIQTIPPGPAQASLGATLAQVDLDAGSPVAALADLAQTAAANLPPALLAQRNTLAGLAQAEGGNAIAAVTTLAPVATTAPAASSTALNAEAQIAEQSGQWPLAEQALHLLVSQSIPPAGSLNASQENLLLRLATAASHNNDSGALAALYSKYGGRVGADSAGGMFQALCAPPLTGDEGLNQALREIAQLQAMPAMVDAVTGTAADAVAKPQSPAAGAQP